MKGWTTTSFQNKVKKFAKDFDNKNKKKKYSNYNPWKGWKGKSKDFPGAKEKIIKIDIDKLRKKPSNK